MTNHEIIKGLEQLSNAERLMVIEAATRMIQDDTRHDPSHRLDVREQVLAAAAKELASDYSSDSTKICQAARNPIQRCDVRNRQCPVNRSWSFKVMITMVRCRQSGVEIDPEAKKTGEG